MNTTFGTQRGYDISDRVELNDHGDHIIVGTVTQTIGGLFRDSAVEVFWDHLGYTNWERPQDLRPAVLVAA